MWKYHYYQNIRAMELEYWENAFYPLCVTLLISHVTFNVSHFRWQHYYKTVRTRILQFWDCVHHPLCITCHMTHIMCHLSPVTHHMSDVTYSMWNFFWGEGGRAKIGTFSGWQVSHPLGTPHLVLIRTTIVVYCNSIDSIENLNSATYFRFSKKYNFTYLRFAH